MIKSSWDMWCDGKDCQWKPSLMGDNRENFIFNTKSGLIQKAKREGWKITKRRHLCPECVEDEKSLSKDEVLERELSVGDIPGQIKLINIIDVGIKA